MIRSRDSARVTALRVFLDWDSGRESADAILSARVRHSRLAGPERDLAWEIARGVFRWRGRLDWQLSALVDRPLAELDPAVLWVLRMGLYQLEYLDRIPGHAAVDTSVELAKRCASRGAAALVNAVLRRAPAALADVAEPDASRDPAGHLEARTSHPRWILERWLARYGFRRTLALAAAGNRKPALTLRVASGRVDGAALAADLRAHGIEAEPGRYLPDRVRLPGGWQPELREILESGLAVVQDEAAGMVAHLARPHRGATVLGVCAAPGGKVIHFAQLCGEALVVAADISPGRARVLRRSVAKLGLTGIRTIVADGRQPATRGGFSRVLVDAPCTNTGVLGKRPDARWRRGPEDLVRLAELQGRLLDAARSQVGPGGLLVYSTCSLEPEENEHVIRDYLGRHPTDVVVPAGEVLPEELVRDGFLATDPVSHGVDGAFAAALRPGDRARGGGA